MEIGGGRIVDRQHALGAPFDHLQAHVGRDPEQPRTGSAAAFEPRQRPPRQQQRVLQGVLGVVHRTQHPVAVRKKPRAMRLDEVRKSSPVAGTSGRKQIVLSRR